MKQTVLVMLAIGTTVQTASAWIPVSSEDAKQVGEPAQQTGDDAHAALVTAAVPDEVQNTKEPDWNELEPQPAHVSEEICIAPPARPQPANPCLHPPMTPLHESGTADYWKKRIESAFGDGTARPFIPCSDTLDTAEQVANAVEALQIFPSSEPTVEQTGAHAALVAAALPVQSQEWSQQAQPGTQRRDSSSSEGGLFA